MEGAKKEPYVTRKEFDKRVIRYREVPPFEVAPGVKVNLVSAEKLSIIFSSMEPNATVPLHRHEAEQIMIVVDGAGDQIADGKLYHLEKGDVFIAPSNLEHGTYVSGQGLKTIEAFSPPRHDYVARLEALKKGLSA